MLNFKKFLNINIREVVNFFSMSKSENKKLTFALYLILTSLFLSIIYFLSPKLIDYSSREYLIKETLKAKSNIDIKKLKSIDYKIYPSPRLVISGVSFDYHEGFILAEDSNINVILNIKSLLMYKNFNYKNIIVKKSESRISLNNINKSIKAIKKNKKKLVFEKSKFIFFRDNKNLFEITDVKLIIKKKNLENILNFKGLLLDKKIFINFTSKGNEKNNFFLRMPDIDSSIKIFFESDKSKDKIISGLANIEILNNFFQFNFKKNDKYEIEDGYIRNKSINSAIKGYLIFKPNFYFDLYLEPNVFNTKDIFLYILDQYLLPDIKKLNLIKKLNGKLNLAFENLFEGKIIFENGAISLKDFTIKKRNEIIKIETYIEDLNKSKKVVFNFSRALNDKADSKKFVNIKGLIIPFKNKVVFKQIFLDKEPFSDEEIKFYEKKFEEQIVKGYLGNIFYYRKFNNFFRNFKE